MPALESVTALTAVWRAYGATHRTQRDWLSREGSPAKNSGRNGIFPVDIERQIHRRIVRLEQVCFRLARNHIRRFAVQICGERRIRGIWNAW